MHFLWNNSVFYCTITCCFCMFLLFILLSLQACEVGFAVDVVQQELSGQELSGGCPTSRNHLSSC